MTSKAKQDKVRRRRYSEEFKSEALALAEKLGGVPAARELGLHASQLYYWRAQAARKASGLAEEESQATEIVKLKRRLSDQAEELAILKKATAYFARHLK